MKKFVSGLVVGLFLPFLGAYLFVKNGGMPVATKGNPLPFEKFVAKTALHAAIKNEGDRPSPIPATEATFVTGANVYMNHCVVCHGLPGQPKTPVAQGLFPPPPQLFKGHGVTDDPVGETYWKVKNGIRLTGMPGFEDSLTDTESWAVSLLLAHTDSLPENAKAILKPAK